jgi:hypothetical protein
LPDKRQDKGKAEKVTAGLPEILPLQTAAGRSAQNPAVLRKSGMKPPLHQKSPIFAPGIMRLSPSKTGD